MAIQMTSGRKSAILPQAPDQIADLSGITEKHTTKTISQKMPGGELSLATCHQRDDALDQATRALWYGHNNAVQNTNSQESCPNIGQ